MAVPSAFQDLATITLDTIVQLSAKVLGFQSQSGYRNSFPIVIEQHVL